MSRVTSAKPCDQALPHARRARAERGREEDHGSHGARTSGRGATVSTRDAARGGEGGRGQHLDGQPSARRTSAPSRSATAERVRDSRRATGLPAQHLRLQPAPRRRPRRSGCWCPRLQRHRDGVDVRGDRPGRGTPRLLRGRRHERRQPRRRVRGRADAARPQRRRPVVASSRRDDPLRANCGNAACPHALVLRTDGISPSSVGDDEAGRLSRRPPPDRPRPHRHRRPAGPAVHLHRHRSAGRRAARRWPKRASRRDPSGSSKRFGIEDGADAGHRLFRSADPSHRGLRRQRQSRPRRRGSPRTDTR